jgi:hypothetical protein
MKSDQRIIEDYPILLLPKLAFLLSQNEAIILQQLHYWLLQSKNLRDNQFWIYNSIVEWKKQFPFLCANTIRRTLNNLKAKGYVHTGNYNRVKYDKTLWYTIDYQKLTEICNEHSIVVNPIPQNDHVDISSSSEPIPEITRENTIGTQKPDSKEESKATTDLIYNHYAEMVRPEDAHEAKMAIMKQLKSHSKEELLRTIDNYASSQRFSPEIRYRLMAKAFFGPKKKFVEYLQSTNSASVLIPQSINKRGMSDAQKYLLKSEEE